METNAPVGEQGIIHLTSSIVDPEGDHRQDACGYGKLLGRHCELQLIVDDSRLLQFPSSFANFLATVNIRPNASSSLSSTSFTVGINLLGMIKMWLGRED